jgi:hypothetical protein
MLGIRSSGGKPVPGFENLIASTGPQPGPVGSRCFCLPIQYHDDEFMATLHTASYDAVAEALPSELIRPARWIDGRALLSVAAFRYRTTTCAAPDGATFVMAPYAEVSVGAVVTVGPAPRLLPVLSSRVQVFVLHLPVTTLEARDVGILLWGFPKFVADLDFVEHPDLRQVTVAENGRHVLTLAVRPGGPALADDQPHVVYTSLGGRLLRTVVPMSGYRQIRLGRSSGRLEVGDHPVGRHLAGLDISPTPLAAFNYLSHRCVLPAGSAIGSARDVDGYAGSDRSLGRYTVRYPGSPPLDQYAGVPGTATTARVGA